jgi:hypothetical protein
MDAIADKLEAIEAAVTKEEETEESEEDSELDLEATLLEALDLMKRCAVFFDYASDNVLVANLTKQHRLLMTRLSNTIYDFAEEVEQALDEQEDE